MIPVATTRITVLATADDPTARDSYDPAPTWVPVARDVRAVIHSPAGSERTARGEAETVTGTLSCDPFTEDLSHLHRVQDSGGILWDVVWATYRPGLGMDHWTAGLVRYDGQEP